MSASSMQLLAGQGGPSLLRKAVQQPRTAAMRSHRRQSVAVRAAATGPGSPKRPGGDLVQNILSNTDTFLTRYDVLSCGMGALACTSYCVYQGQDPWTALQITVAATVVGLVANEFLFENRQ